MKIYEYFITWSVAFTGLPNLDAMFFVRHVVRLKKQLIIENEWMIVNVDYSRFLRPRSQIPPDGDYCKSVANERRNITVTVKMYLVFLWTVYTSDSNRAIAPDVLHTASVF